MAGSEQENQLLFFDVCSKIEGLCAELYHYYSELFCNDNDCSQLWKKTALEEENHQKKFEFANQLKRDCILEFVVKIDKAYWAHNKLVALLAHVKLHPPEITMALSKAIEMEEALSDLHVETAITCKDPQISKLFTALGGDDKDHVRALRHFHAIKTLHLSQMREDC